MKTATEEEEPKTLKVLENYIKEEKNKLKTLKHLKQS